MTQVEFVSSLFHFAATLNALALSDTELGLFSAVVLLTADRPGVTDVKAVERHQDRLVDALKVQVTFTNRLSSLTLCRSNNNARLQVTSLSSRYTLQRRDTMATSDLLNDDSSLRHHGCETP